MSNTLLRTMTLKSIIGFGEFPLLTVQELINLKKHHVLVKMYYCLEKINFTSDVLDLLEIRFERVIPKPGKNYDMYKKHIWGIVDDISIMERTFADDNPEKWVLYNQKRAAIKLSKITSNIKSAKNCSKIKNRNRNQGKSYR